jgi:hypothetical protein
MDLTRCGLLVERAAELAELYREQGNWNDVKEVWFDERRSNRSTKGSSQGIFRVLTDRFKNAPASLPNPRALPDILAQCATERDKAQVLYLYLVADDALVRYVVHEYAATLPREPRTTLDFSDDALVEILSALEFADGTPYEYAASTTRRWCEGFRSVLREVGVIETRQGTDGGPPSIGDIPLLVATGYSYASRDEDWVDAPTGLLYLFQPQGRWEELFDRVAGTDGWKYVDLHGSLQLRPNDGPYSHLVGGGEDGQ